MSPRASLRLVFALASMGAAGAASGCGLLDPSHGTRGEVDDHLETWQARGPGAYAYRLTQLCFCPPDHTRTFVVTVSGRQIVDVRDAETGAPRPSTYVARTVEDLFSILYDAIDRDADQLEVEYDPALGYPTSIFVDYEEQAADEELRITAEALAAVAP